MNENLDYTLRFFKSGDENQVMDLVTSTFNAINKRLWLWKYLGNPLFDESLVFIAENNDRIIGCMHYLPRELRIARSLNVKGALGADFAVHADYRQRGIGSSMLKFSRSSKVLEKKEIALTYGFIDRRRADFYRRNIDNTIVPLSTAVYTKYLDIAPIAEKLLSLNVLTSSENELSNNLKEASISVLFRLTGTPPFTLRVENGKIGVSKEESQEHDLVVEGDLYLLLDLFRDGDKGALDLVVGLLKGKIRVQGGVRKMIKFYQIIKTIKRLFLRQGYG